MRAVITGANRGIGLELARQSVARGDTVFAGVRKPEDARELLALARDAKGALTVLPLDVASEASVRTFAKGIPSPVDALVNNAGVMGDLADLEALDLDRAMEVLNVNALGPLRVTRALLPQLRAGGGKKVLHVTSGMGSIGDNTSGGAYPYRMSKAALNMASRSLAADLRGEGIASAVISPGWVKTEMGGAGAPTPVADSVKGILRQLDGLTLESSGRFLDHTGKQWEW